PEALAASDPPDAILYDLDEPVDESLLLLTLFRSLPGMGAVPVVLLRTAQMPLPPVDAPGIVAVLTRPCEAALARTIIEAALRDGRHPRRARDGDVEPRPGEQHGAGTWSHVRGRAERALELGARAAEQRARRVDELVDTRDVGGPRRRGRAGDDEQEQGHGGGAHAQSLARPKKQRNPAGRGLW